MRKMRKMTPSIMEKERCKKPTLTGRCFAIKFDACHSWFIILWNMTNICMFSIACHSWFILLPNMMLNYAKWSFRCFWNITSLCLFLWITWLCFPCMWVCTCISSLHVRHVPRTTDFKHLWQHTGKVGWLPIRAFGLWFICVSHATKALNSLTAFSIYL
jgi:hypothetical protein